MRIIESRTGAYRTFASSTANLTHSNAGANWLLSASCIIDLESGRARIR